MYSATFYILYILWYFQIRCFIYLHYKLVNKASKYYAHFSDKEIRAKCFIWDQYMVEPLLEHERLTTIMFAFCYFITTSNKEWSLVTWKWMREGSLKWMVNINSAAKELQERLWREAFLVWQFYFCLFLKSKFEKWCNDTRFLRISSVCLGNQSGQYKLPFQ